MVWETRVLSSDIRLQNLELAPSNGSGYLQFDFFLIPFMISVEFDCESKHKRCGQTDERDETDKTDETEKV